ncbi:uncharacterized protein IL334_000762 [Kwoniella shivajii]|uniref:UBA/TS-N domain-containing protein n=1 Tax=Kwoniella shivajii TaxID=564305 RepID=A0ABZ1CU98_9TREE|nr:hypothetical protein IL334_000762 [Kwoniella shivajii]
MAAPYTAQEKQYFDQLFAIVDKDNTGILPGQDAYPFLTSCNLPTTSLGEIWALADPENNGFLTKEGWYRAARIIGWLQKGGATTVDDTLAQKAGPLPTFDKGPPPPPTIQPQLTGQRAAPLSAHNTGSGLAQPSLPALTPADRAKFTRLFAGAGPHNGLVSGDKARDMFLKSGLSYDKLGQIWNLADTQERGSLDLTDFVIGMYLIQSCMTNSNLILPAVLPPGIYEVASGGRAPPPKAPASPISRQHTGGAVPSPIRPQYTGGVGGTGILQPQRTGQSATGNSGLATPPRSNTAPSTKFASPPTASSFSTLPSTSSFGGPTRQMSGFAQSQPQSQQWDVTPQAKATSDQFFSQLDTQNRGVIEGDVAVPFMLQSQLDENTLASIWDLADIRKEGKLTRDEFAVALHLINAKLAGQEPPTSLPNSLVPPSLREAYGNGAQEVLQNQGASSATKDLFDIFADDEPAPTPKASSPQQQSQAQPFQASAFLPQPPPPPTRRMTAQTTGQRAISPAPTGQPAQTGFGMAPFAPAARGGDLLGDDSAEDKPSSVPDHSAELGNKQNQLANTTRGLSDLEKTRGELEENAKSSAAQIEELEAKLSSARSRHETETKAVADLRTRVAEQKDRNKKLESEVISAESDLSAMRSEKDELEQALLRDKEEIRGLQKMMKEVEEEKTGMKLVLEKLRKEARQQKGMLSIAKKQLSTAEGGRDAVQKETRDVEQEIEEDKRELERVPSPQQHVSPPPQAPPALFSPSVAAGVPLPATPKALSPAPTGTSTRSNNPFERLVGARSLPPSQATSPPPSQQEEPTSPGFGAGAFAAVGAAAGVVVAGAETLYDAAKDAVSGGSPEKTEPKELEEADPFGAATVESEKTPVPQASGEETDPFGASTVKESTDPFGAPSTPKATGGSGFDEFDSGFGDSFSAAPLAAADKQPTEEMHLAPASEHVGEAAPTDFDSAFAAFDQPPAELADNAQNHVDLDEGIPSGISKSDIPSDFGARPEAERTYSTQASAPESIPSTPATEVPSSGFGSPTNSERAPLPPSALAQEVKPEYESSDDEEEGPEDLEGPTKKGYSAKSADDEFNFDEPEATAEPGLGHASAPDLGLGQPILSVEEPTPTKVRRHAPPPPANKSSLPPGAAPSAPTSAQSFGGTDEFDPFGAPVTSTTVTGTGIASQQGVTPKTASFDEDEFDFSDLPPAQVAHEQGQGQGISQHHSSTTHQASSSSAFDDDFANFDDEFEKPDLSNIGNGGSENSGSGGTSESVSKNYEMVSPQPQSQRFDEWGYGSHPSAPPQGQAQAQGQQVQQSQQPQGTKGFSFDDAFGGDFEPSGSSSVQHDDAFSPPSGPPPGQSEQHLQAPPMPQRRPSTAQPDDIEDVKKLCAMGFSRTLVVEALAANGYDFQKSLNVLLSA